MTDIPLPGLSKGGSGSDGLVEEQLADGSLEKLFALARKNEKGYDIVNGILVQRTEDCLGDVVDRIIVPVDRRLKLWGWPIVMTRQGTLVLRKPFLGWLSIFCGPECGGV